MVPAWLRFALILLVLSSSACLPATAPVLPVRWDYADLRAVFPVDDISPDADFIAAYTRQNELEFEIRLDFLDLIAEPSSTIFIALDTQPAAGTTNLPFEIATAAQTQEWDQLIIIPSLGSPAILIPVDGEFTPQTSLAARLARSPQRDDLVVSLSRRLFPLSPAGFYFQAFSVSHASQTALDQTPVLHSGGRPPARAPLLLAFWNTFPAYTPAQALRRWDGAHTGPFGGRHGLSILLSAVRRSRVPLALLDLKQPASLSALDFLGTLPTIRELQREKLLILPDAAPGSPALALSPSQIPPAYWRAALHHSQQTAARFGLPASQLLYDPSLPFSSASRHPVIFTPAAAQPMRSAGHTLFPLPPPDPDQQVDADGLTIAAKRQLINQALSASPALTILGGDLTQSAWAAPPLAEAGMWYIANHPWILPLNEASLLSFPTPAGQQAVLQPANALTFPRFPCLPPQEDIQNCPPAGDPLRTGAWHTYLAAFHPLPSLTSSWLPLRVDYTYLAAGQLLAASWAGHPQPNSNCQVDLDQNGIFECLLANQTFFALLDAQSGGLTYLFLRQGDAVHQVAGPSAQLISGLSSPAQWETINGRRVDKAVLPGAFFEPAAGSNRFQVSVSASEIRFSAPATGLEKVYRLEPDRFVIQINSSKPFETSLPLIQDPWTRFTPGWAAGYSVELASQSLTNQFPDGTGLTINSSIPFELTSYTHSLPFLALPEDPNFEYPPGHYLPLGLDLLKFSSQGTFYLEVIPQP